jgi:N6-adenosine-specific RNA methylase IME4
MIVEKYKTILMDPPWPERGGGKCKRGADRHYDLISRKEEILRVILQSGVWKPHSQCHLWIWTTSTYLPWALWLIGALGFEYKTDWIWEKPRMGLGQYRRGQHEQLLFGSRGKACVPKPKDRGTSLIRIMDVGSAPRVHSEKPEESYEVIERVSRPPRLEMFARRPRDGWDVWGNEV